MRTSISIRQRGNADQNLTRVIFGAWVIGRTRSADQLEGWIDDRTASLSHTDLDEIAAAIRQS
jgi:hypothetical protein